MNLVVMDGRLAADPELRYTASGVAVCTCSIAVNRPFDRDKADFHTIVIWRELAETVASHCKKGRKITVQGWLQSRSWESDNGKRYVTEVVADRVEFGAKPKGAEANDG